MEMLSSAFSLHQVEIIQMDPNPHPHPNPNPNPNHAEVAEERRLLQQNFSAKADAVRLEADARVNALTQQLEERLEEAKRVHGAQLTVLTAHYDSLVRHPHPAARGSK